MSCITPEVRTPCSTAAAMEPAPRIRLIARMWCSWPWSTPDPLDRSTPSDVPNSDDSMSCVARALPANSTSTKPPAIRAQNAGAAPVWTTAGPPTQSTFLPAALTSRICAAIWRTCRNCGFSLETTEFMNSKTLSSACTLTGATTLTPRDPQTSRSPALMSLTGTVVTASCSPWPVTTSPQSISGRVTWTQCPSMRTSVSRLVVE